MNDNDATTAVLNGTVPTTCNLQYYHKEDPSPEGKEFTECHPYKDSSCCHEATVTTPAAINKAYGAGYEWDRCGALSQACERFFVQVRLLSWYLCVMRDQFICLLNILVSRTQEACLYECDPNAGLYRKCNEAQVAAAADDETDACHMNTWEMYKMPIKASYCDAWYLACYGDKFCGGNDGNFFSCAANYSPKSSSSSNSSDEVMPVWAIVLLCIFGVLALVICGALAFTVKKEKDGKPIFNPLLIEANKEAEAPAVEEDTSY